MSIDALQQQGKEFYKRKEYTKALEYFDRAIGRLPSVQLLDKRAACHFNLNDLPAALKDAKKTIQLNGDDPTGYLRAGKVLAKMEKPSVALEIYSHGLRRVRRVGQGYEALKRVHGELQSQLAPPKSIDPLTVLPRELALYILEYLSFRQIVGISKVSKQWNRFVQSEPHLWRHLDLAEARTKVKGVFISKCINVGRGKLKEITLSRLYDFDKTIAALVKSCPIEKVTLLQTGVQNLNLVNYLKFAVKLRELRIGIDTDLSTETLTSLLQTCGRTLEVFEYQRKLSTQILQVFDAPQLKTFSVVFMDPVHGDPYYRFAQASPRLETFKVTETPLHIPLHTRVDLSLAKQMTHVELSVGRSRASYISLPRSLRMLKLHIVGIHAPTDFFDGTNDQTTNGFHLPNLHTLELQIPGISMDAVMYGLGLRNSSHTETIAALSELESEEKHEPPSKIKSLSLFDVTPDDGFLGWSNSRLDELEHLIIRRPLMPTSADFYDSTALAAVTDLRHLRSLDLSDTTIDGAGVKRIVSSGACTLKELTLHDCTRLNRDAVDWARSKGIKVEHKTTTISSGKRVRYR